MVVKEHGRWFVKLEKTGKLIPSGGYASEGQAGHLLGVIEAHKHDLRDEFEPDKDKDMDMDMDIDMDKDMDRSTRAAVRKVREIRDTTLGLQLRSAPEGSPSPGTLVGYAAVFHKLSVDLGMFREEIAPGAFTEALVQCDVRCLYNHEPDYLLGRMSSGTLRLAEDDTGLWMECDLPDTQIGRDIAAMCRREDLSGQSFSFTVGADQWDYAATPPLRIVRQVKQLLDVGPVTFPAYTETSVACRSLETARTAPIPEPEPEPEPAPAPLPDFSAIHARLRLLEVI